MQKRKPARQTALAAAFTATASRSAFPTQINRHEGLGTWRAGSCPADASSPEQVGACACAAAAGTASPGASGTRVLTAASPQSQSSRLVVEKKPGVGESKRRLLTRARFLLLLLTALSCSSLTSLCNPVSGRGPAAAPLRLRVGTCPRVCVLLLNPAHSAAGGGRPLGLWGQELELDAGLP